MNALSSLEPEDPQPRAAIGHMPFTGHRTVATIWAQQTAASRRNLESRRKAMGFGFDPDSLKGGE